MAILVTMARLDGSAVCQTALAMGRTILGSGHQILVAAGDALPAAQQDWEEAGAQIVAAPGLTGAINPLARRRLLREIEATHLVDPIELIVVFGQDERGSALWLADRLDEHGIPCVFWAESPHQFRGRFVDWQRTGFTDLMHKHLGLAVCTSDSSASEFVDEFRIPSARVERMPMAVVLPTRISLEDDKRDQLRSEWNAGEGDFLWVNPAQLSVANGQDLLFDALLGIHRKQGNARLVLLDPGPEERSAEDHEFRNVLRQRIKDERLGRTVFIAEPGTYYHDLLPICDGVLHSQRHQTTTQHREILQSLAAEKPTVLTDCAEVCRMLNSGDDSHIIASDSAESIELAMRDMMQLSGGERKWMGTGGQAMIAEYFDARKIARRFLASLEQLLTRQTSEAQLDNASN